MPPAGAVLRLSTGSAFTRAEGRASDPGHTDGETSVVPDPYAEANEEKIDRVDLFFFDSERSEDAPFYIHKITRLGEKTAADLTVKVPIENIGKFQQEDNDKKVYIYALVNLPDGIKVDESAMTVTPGTDAAPVSATLANLHALKVSTTEFAPSGSGAVAAVPSSFVMRGGNTVDLEDGSDSRLVYVRGTIELERLASKIRLWAHIPGYIYVNSSTGLTVDKSEKDEEDVEMWKPVLTEIGEDGNRSDAVKLYIYNIAQGGYIDGRLGAEADFLYSDVARANADQGGVARRLVTGEGRLTIPEKDIDAAYEHSHNVAYYSYPNHWDSGTPSEQHQTYVILTMPWAKVDKGNPDALPSEYDVYYYQIPVNALRDMGKEDAECLEPNRYYRIKLNVGMLGSKDLGSALPVEASWEVLPWTTADVDVSVKPRRYLVVNQKEWVMNNIWTLEIPFSTSHETEVEACYVTYFRYNDIWGISNYTDGEHNATEFSEWLLAAKGDETKGYKGLPGGQEGEGLIVAKDFTSGKDVPTEREVKRDDQLTRDSDYFGQTAYSRKTYIITHQEKYSSDQQLYYKKKYFYDDVVSNYLYYVGREHPKTYQLMYLKRPTEDQFVQTTDINGNTVSVENQSTAWKKYKEYYDLESIYDCAVDHEKGVIRLKHPLVWWEEVRGRSETYETVSGETVNGIYIWNPTGWFSGYWVRESTTYETRIYSNELKYYRPVLSESGNSLRDEFSRCEIIIKVKHKDWNGEDDLYRETIRITQYPAVYVQESHNYGGISGGGNGRYSGGNQYVRINGNKTYDGSSTGYWEVGGQGAFGVTNSMTRYNGTNMNPNMYVVSISQLSEEDEQSFDLGDPRSLTNNINLSDVSLGQPAENNSPSSNKETDAKKTWAAWKMTYSPYPEVENGVPTSASTWLDGVSGDGRQLAYYYPTDETPEGQNGSKENFVAPIIRIASSFGKIQQLKKFEARRRCAAYQEAGRPAGRWRLPTKAEVKYVANLSKEGKIPILFGLSGNDATYWTSTGIVKVDRNLNVTNADSDGTDAVRCVYDDWYWIKQDGTPDLAPGGSREENFYWGDRPKDNTQTQSLLQKSLNKKPVIATDE